jgi:hypothetical protein
MRRSGTVEGDAGGGSDTDQANKIANSVTTNISGRQFAARC